MARAQTLVMGHVYWNGGYIRMRDRGANACFQSQVKSYSFGLSLEPWRHPGTKRQGKNRREKTSRIPWPEWFHSRN